MEDLEAGVVTKVINFVKENLVTVILGAVIVVGAIAIISKRD